MESSALGDVVSPKGNIPKLLYRFKEFIKHALIRRVDKIKVYSQAQIFEIHKIKYKKQIYQIQPSIDIDNHKPVSMQKN